MTEPDHIPMILSSVVADIADASVALAASVDGLLLRYAGENVQRDELDQLAALTASVTGAAGALIREDNEVVDTVVLALQDRTALILPVPSTGAVLLVIAERSADLGDVLARLNRARTQMSHALTPSSVTSAYMNVTGPPGEAGRPRPAE